jgi:hypothetical protein
MTATLPLLSGVVISAERHAYNKIRNKYAAIAKEHAVDFLQNFSSTFADIEAVHDNMHLVVQEKLFRVTDEAVRDLIAHGIHDIDDSSFIGDHLTAALAHWQDQFDQIDDQYRAIVMKQEELDAHRKNRRLARTQVMGFTLKGHAKAATYNTASNVVHGMFNLAAKTASAMLALGKKDAIYKDENNRLMLANALHDLLFYVHIALIDLVHANTDGQRYEYLTQDAVDRADRLLANVQKGRLPESAVASVLLEALSLNPYSEDAYKNWFERFGDRDNSVGSMARYFGISSIDEAKRALVEKKVAGLKLDSAEEVNQSIAAIEEYAHSVGFTDIELLRKSIRAKAQRIDETKRTYNGIVHSSVTEAQDAEQRTVNSVTYATHEQASVERSRKSVGILLGTGIFLLPYVFAWLTLRKGYSALARVLALGWLAVMVYALFEDRLSGNHTPSTPSVQESMPAIPVPAPVQEAAPQPAAPTPDAVESPAAPVSGPATVEVPFIGKRTFNFDGGNGTQRTIEIDEQAMVRVHYVGTTSSSLDYEGAFSNPLPLKDGSALKFENGQVYLMRNGVIETGCMGENQACASALYE